jgi:hypothetical protein
MIVYVWLALFVLVRGTAGLIRGMRSTNQQAVRSQPRAKGWKPGCVEIPIHRLQSVFHHRLAAPAIVGGESLVAIILNLKTAVGAASGALRQRCIWRGIAMMLALDHDPHSSPIWRWPGWIPHPV